MELEIDGIRCHYEQTGEGRDLLLLHGWGGCVDSWLPVTEHFAQMCRVTVLDFPGHGKSGFPPEEGWGVEDYCRFTAAFIEKVGISGCDVIAHSFGGRVALRLAATSPELLGRLLLTDSAGLLPKRGKWYTVKTGFFSTVKKCLSKLPHGEAILRKLPRFGSSDYRALPYSMKSTFVRVVNEDLSWCLPKVRSETLLIWGRNDTATPLWMGQQMEKEIRGSALIVLENAGHFAYLDQCAAFLRIADAFFFPTETASKE